MLRSLDPGHGTDSLRQPALPDTLASSGRARQEAGAEGGEEGEWTSDSG